MKQATDTACSTALKGDAAALLNHFENGRLVRPHTDAPDLLDLVKAVASLCGSNRIQKQQRGPKVQKLIKLVGPADHYIFVLIDGMGVNLLKLLNKRFFLRKSWCGTLHTVFPSTTASVLTTIATGASPAEHGICGWWVYFPGGNVTATILPYVDRYEPKISIAARGIRPADAFQIPSLLPTFSAHPITVVPHYLAGSIYSTYASGDTESYGYRNIEDGFRKVAAFVRKADGPTYTYLYFPQVDSLCHRRGWNSGRVRQVLLELDAGCRKLRSLLGSNARMIVTADHGFSNLFPEKQYDLFPDDPLLELLVCPPTGNEATPVFHVRKGCEHRFQEQFRERFGNAFLLLSRREVDELRLLGPGPLSSRAKEHLGDFMAVSSEAAALCYFPDGEKRHQKRAFHSSLLPSEMRIPLILA